MTARAFRHATTVALLRKATITIAQLALTALRLAGFALFMAGVGVGLPLVLFAAMGR